MVGVCQLRKNPRSPWTLSGEGGKQCSESKVPAHIWKARMSEDGVDDGSNTHHQARGQLVKKVRYSVIMGVEAAKDLFPVHYTKHSKCAIFQPQWTW